MTEKRGYKIKWVDWGIGYSYDNIIELNSKLKEHPKLLKLVLKHEIEHFKHPSFWDTMKIEVKDMFNFEKQRLLSQYLRKHPIMKLQASMPIWFDKSGFNFNLFLLIFYAITILSGVFIMSFII